jgi:hypothetical protein
MYGTCLVVLFRPTHGSICFVPRPKGCFDTRETLNGVSVWEHGLRLSDSDQKRTPDGCIYNSRPYKLGAAAGDHTPCLVHFKKDYFIVHVHRLF